MITAVVEDYLAAIYLLAAEGQTVIGARLADRLGVSPPTVTETVRRLSQDGYATVSERKEIHLTEAGRAIAAATVRRHRVTERWLTDALGLDWAQAHQAAHRLEHAVTPEVVERLFAVLGRPATCPHGNPIPGSGSEPVAGIPLDQVATGTEVLVDHIPESGEQLAKFLTHLGQLGVRPGVRLRVEERAPWAGTVTVRKGDQTLVLGYEAAARIVVRPAAEEPVHNGTSGGGSESDAKVVVSVESVQGACQAGHQVGERFELGCHTPPGLCSEAFHTIFPLAKVLRAQAQRQDTGTTALEVPCPEEGSVVFRVQLSEPDPGRSQGSPLRMPPSTT